MEKYIEKLQSKKNLTRDEIQALMTEIMSGRMPEEKIKDFLLAMNAKNPTVEEITGAAQIMRQFVLPVEIDRSIVLDTCGTGGSGKNMFNISTAVAFVVAASGVTVAKHGGRYASSLCGSADVLEELGVNILLPHDKLSECLKTVGLAFLFAQRHHPAMKYVAAARKALGVKAIFNILGPLTNPAKATHQIMGVYSKDLTSQLAHVLKNLGSKRAIIVHGADGLDEISTIDKTFISEFDGQEVHSYEIIPEEFGLTRAFEQDLKVRGKPQSARAICDVLDGVKGPKRDIVLLNAAFALYAAEKVRSPEEGMILATQSIDQGKAKRVLEQLKEFTRVK